VVFLAGRDTALWNIALKPVPVFYQWFGYKEKPMQVRSLER
jgi:hypothetical protein